jgi:hypothetical protein
LRVDAACQQKMHKYVVDHLPSRMGSHLSNLSYARDEGLDGTLT